MEISDLEERATEECKDVKMLTNDSIELVDNKDKANMKALAKSRKIKLCHKGMKKLKVRIVEVTNRHTKYLAMESYTPCEACIVLKEMFSISNLRQHFTNLVK